MTKILRSFLLLLFVLTINACVPKSIITNTHQQTITPIVTTQTAPNSLRTAPRIIRSVAPSVPEPFKAPPRAMSVAPSTSGSYHQLKTVQGSILTVQERSNGFIFPQYRDKVVLLQIFGQDCPYCFKEMPIINSIKQRYVGSLQVLALQAQNKMSPQTASRLIQRFQMNYPVIDKDVARDLLSFIQKTYGWTGILPYMLIIKNGVTEYSFSGEVSHQELDEAVRSLI